MCRVVAKLSVRVSSSCVCLVVVFVVVRLGVWLGTWLGSWLGGAFEIVPF